MHENDSDERFHPHPIPLDPTPPHPTNQAALTDRFGPLWHVLVARDSAEMGTAVESHAGTFLDARVGAHRVVVWQHDLPLR
jgi:hypothetical protein